MDLLIKALIGLLPVVVFLYVLYHLDSHRLLSPFRVYWTMVFGVYAAGIAFFSNIFLLDLLDVDRITYSRFIAPNIEEGLKALVLLYLFRTNRVGFLVDAAILGFAVGTGFAVFENMYFLLNATGLHVGDWIIRGFGTAIMHGGAIAIFALITQHITDRHLKTHLIYYVPGFIAAISIHSLYNHFPVSPLWSTLIALLTLPTVFYLVFRKSEVSIHNWLEADFRAHEEMLEQMISGEFPHTERGRFLLDFQTVFEGPIVDHMHTYVRIHTELIINAEGILLAREDDVDVEVDPEVKRKVLDLHDLEQKIGQTGLLAMKPHLHFSKREFWELYMLEDELAHDAHLKEKS
ncbi:MAG: PrsW family intramembrane metalloprotease [Alphaproteobacteria bacterium]|nr:MAG: PrsW family intramembrane metalloprotease [Alphaproteobacteria bacterium]